MNENPPSETMPPATPPSLVRDSLTDLRVIVADDHPAVLLGLAATLNEAGGFSVVGRAASTDTLLALLDSQAADVLVTDFMIPIGDEPDGLHLLAKILRMRPELPVVVLTMITHAETLCAMLRMGVMAIVDKHASIGEIPVAVSRAHGRRTYVSSSFDVLIRAFERRHATVNRLLSTHEIEVVRRFAAGVRLPEIARQLNRSRKTISRQKCDAMRKLGLTNDTELTDYARSQGIVLD